jgi:hypothetical protein
MENTIHVVGLSKLNSWSRQKSGFAMSLKKKNADKLIATAGMKEISWEGRLPYKLKSCTVRYRKFHPPFNFQTHPWTDHMLMTIYFFHFSPPPQGVFFFALPRARFWEGKKRTGGEGKGDGRHCRWQCGSGGSTRVEFRESVYFRQIIGNFEMFSVCRRSRASPITVAWSGCQCFLHIIPQRLGRCVWTSSWWQVLVGRSSKNLGGQLQIILEQEETTRDRDWPKRQRPTVTE